MEIPDHKRIQRAVVSRRVLIIGSLSAGVTIGTTGAAWSATERAPIVALPMSTTVGTPSGAISKVPAYLGGVITPTGADLPLGSEVTLTWDSGLYALESRPHLTDDNGAAVPCSFAGKPVDLGDGSQQVGVILGGALRMNRPYRLTVGSPLRRRYPHDLVPSPRVGGLSVGRAGPVPSPAPASKPKGGMWGAILGGGWRPQVWEDLHCWLPSSATIRSVGPDPVPAGTLLEVTLDSRVAEAVTFSTLGGHDLDATSRSVSHVLITTCALPAAIAAGERFTLTITVASRTVKTAIAGFQAPTVQVRAQHRTAGQRTTGQESQARTDNAVDSRGVEEARGLMIARGSH